VRAVEVLFVLNEQQQQLNEFERALQPFLVQRLLLLPFPTLSDAGRPQGPSWRREPRMPGQLPSHPSHPSHPYSL
jgi:hypothetical protein